MAQGWSNANSFFNGMQNGIRFVGDLYSLRDSREDRERKFKREDAAERRSEGRYNAFLQGADDQHRAKLNALEEYDENRSFRDRKREVDLAKLNRAYEILGNKKLRDMQDAASLANLQKTIDSAKKTGLGLEYDKETLSSRIAKTKDWKNEKGDGKGSPKQEYIDIGGYKVKTEKVFDAYKKYLETSEDENHLTFSEYVESLARKAKGGKPASGSEKDPLKIDLSSFLINP